MKKILILSMSFLCSFCGELSHPGQCSAQEKAIGHIEAYVVDMSSISQDPSTGVFTAVVGDKFVDCSNFGDGEVCNF